MVEYKVSVTDDYEPLMALFIKNELEFSEEEPVSTDIIKAWKMINGDNELIGGIVLARREGEYIIDGIAVEEKYRTLKLGNVLLEKAIEQVRDLGGKKLFLVARAPGFFRKRGFSQVDEKAAPFFFECKTCSQYAITCHPEIMELEI